MLDRRTLPVGATFAPVTTAVAEPYIAPTSSLIRPVWEQAPAQLYANTTYLYTTDKDGTVHARELYPPLSRD